MTATRRMRSEGGYTLIEIVITSTLMMVILAIILPQVTGAINLFDNAQVRSTTTDQAQVALSQIEHDVLGANVLYLDNSLPNGNGVVHLQTFGPGGAATCVEYEVVSGAMMRRYKNTSGLWTTAIWTNVISGVVNSTQTGPPPVFNVPASSQYRSLVVILWLNTDTRNVGAAGSAKYTTTITGRAIPANQSSNTGPC